MNIHEYQAKAVLAGLWRPGFGRLCRPMTVAEAVEGAKKLPGPLYVVKSQIHAGGRGKGKFKELIRRRQGRCAAVAKSIAEVEVEKPPRKCSATRW